MDRQGAAVWGCPPHVHNPKTSMQPSDPRPQAPRVARRLQQPRLRTLSRFSTMALQWE